MAAFSFPTNPELNQVYEQPDGSKYTWTGYAWVAQGPVDIETLEERVIALETDIVKKIGQGDDAILNSVRSLTRVVADDNIIAYYEVGREYNISASAVFMDVTATAELLPETIGRANYEGTFYFNDPRDEIPEIPPVLGEDGVTEITPGVPGVPAYPGGAVHTSGLVATYQYTVPGTYPIHFVPDNTESATVGGIETTVIARTGYTIAPSVRFDVCNLSVSPAMSGTYNMGDGQAYQEAQPEVPPDINPDTGEPVPDTGSPAKPEVPFIAEGVVTSDENGNATYNYTRAGDFTITFTPSDGNYAVTAGVNIIMPTLYTISASRDDMIASMSVSPDLTGTYYFGDGIDAIPEVPAVLKPHITATPDRVDDGTGTGTFTPGTPYMWTFAIEGGVDGVWNYGDANLTADAAGAFTYPAVGTYAVTFTRSSDGAVSNLSLVVADGDTAQQSSADEILTDAIPEVPAVPQGEIAYDGVTPVVYTYPREGTYTIRFAPADGNDNPTISFTAHISIPYVINSPEYFMYKALTLSPTCGGYYTMGDGLAAIPEVPATYKNRITATPDATTAEDGTPTPVPYKFSFAVENAPAGSYSYGDGTVDTGGVYTYPGVGTYTVTFTDDATAIVSTLSLVVSDLPSAQTGELEELTPYVPEVPAVPEGRVETTDGTAEYTYPREGDFTITFYPNELSKPVSLGVNCVNRKTYTLTSSRDEMTGTFTSDPALPGTYYFGDGVAAIPEVPAVLKPHITGTPDRTNNGDDTFTAGTPYLWTFAIEGAITGTWAYGDEAATTDTAGTFTYPGPGTYAVTFTREDGVVSNLSLVVADGDTATQTGADEIISDLVPEVPAIPEGTLVSADGTGSYVYPREGTYTVTYVPDDHNYNATTTCIAHTSVPYVINSPEYFMYKALTLSPTCGGYYNMGDYVAAIPEVPAVNKNRITATPDATVAEDGTPTPVPYMFTFSVENAPAGSYNYGDATPTVDTAGVFTYPGPGTYAVTFTDDATGYVSNLSLVVDDAPVAQTGVVEEVSPYVPEVPAIPAGEVTTTDGTAEYTYPRVGDYTITFYPNELSLPVTLAVSAIERTTYTISAPRDECTATLSSSPALPGVYYFGDAVPAVPEVPAVYKKHINATPIYDPAPLTFAFDTGVPGVYSFGDVEATTDTSVNGVSQMTYTAAGDYTVTFTEDSTAAVSTMTLNVPDADPVAQTSPDEILTEAVPEVPAIEEGTLVSADGTGTYVYPRDGTYTIRYVPDDHNYEATASFIAHTSVPYVISSPEYFLYKTLSLSPTCGGQYRMGDGVAEVVGVYKAHIIATPDATTAEDGTPTPVPYKFTFTNDGVTAFSRVPVKLGNRTIRQLKATKTGRSTGSYSYGDVDGTVNADGVFTYPAAGTYTVTFTDDATGAVSTLALNVLDADNIQQVSDNDWYVVPAPAIPEGVVATTDGIAEYTYPRPGDYTITFEPNELSKPVTLAVSAPARTDYSITASRDDRIATLASSPALPGTYYFGDPVPEIPAVTNPDTGEEITPAVPAVPEGTLVSADGTGTYTYAVDGTFTIRYVPDDHNYEATTSFVSHASIPYVITATPTDLAVALSLDIACGGTYRFGDAVAEVPPVLGEDGVTEVTPGVPAIPEGSITTTDGTGTYTYATAGTYTITFEPNELSKPVTVEVAVTAPA